MNEPGLVYLLDDDAVALASLRHVLERTGRQVITFESPFAFLRHAVPRPPCCVVLDLRMPEVSGLEVQQVLTRRADWISVIYMSGCADVRSSVEAMKLGAIDFLVKPFGPAVLVTAVEAGLARSASRASAIAAQKAASDRLAGLSPREREVADLLAEGLRNAPIGGRLGISEKTIKFHRLQLMRKLGIRSVTELMVLRFRAGRMPSGLEEDACRTGGPSSCPPTSGPGVNSHLWSKGQGQLENGSDQRPLEGFGSGAADAIPGIHGRSWRA